MVMIKSYYVYCLIYVKIDYKEIQFVYLYYSKLLNIYVYILKKQFVFNMMMIKCVINGNNNKCKVKMIIFNLFDFVFIKMQRYVFIGKINIILLGFFLQNIMYKI